VSHRPTPREWDNGTRYGPARAGTMAGRIAQDSSRDHGGEVRPSHRPGSVPRGWNRWDSCSGVGWPRAAGRCAIRGRDIGLWPPQLPIATNPIVPPLGDGTVGHLGRDTPARYAFPENSSGNDGKARHDGDRRRAAGDGAGPQPGTARHGATRPPVFRPGCSLEDSRGATRSGFVFYISSQHAASARTL